MELHELSPFPVSIQWEGEEILLKPFDLRAITWAERFFCEENQGGFDRMNRILRSPNHPESFQNAIVDIIFYLSDGFERFGIKTAGQLKDAIRKHEDQLLIFVGLKEALEEVLIDSFPISKKQKSGTVIKRRQDSINWEQIYIKFFMAGGISIDQFYSMTMRQIDAIFPELNFFQIEKLSIDSEIINKKVVYKRPQRALEWSEDDEAIFEKMHQKLVEQCRIN